MLAAFLAVMLCAFFWLARVDRHALPPALGTAALVICIGSYVAYLFTL